MLNQTIKSSTSIEIQKDIKPASIVAFNILGRTLILMHESALKRKKESNELEMDVK